VGGGGGGEGGGGGGRRGGGGGGGGGGGEEETVRGVDGNRGGLARGKQGRSHARARALTRPATAKAPSLH